MEKITKQELIDFETKIAQHWEQGKLFSPVHLSGGNEDELIEIFKEVREGDYIFSNHRSHYHYLLAGGSPETLEKDILDGKSMHISDRKLNFFTSSIVAGCAPIAAGVALALKKQGSKKHVWCFVGDGAEESGHFYEAVRYVDGWNLPCTFIVEDNDRSVATPKSDRYNKSEMNWPSCVRKYYYTAKYPHYDTGKFIDLSNIKIKPWHSTPSYPKPEIKANSETQKIDLTYKDAIKQSMETLAKDKKTIFLGYNVKYGTKAYGTLADIPKEQILETPVAENLMGGLAMGLAIEGFKPVLFFERHDFMLIALDNLVNHLDKLQQMSQGNFSAPLLIRAVLGAKTPLYPGPQHIQDFSDIFKKLFN
ncbi:MAG: thiamine pyrophosphate-dependent enzyme, partial [Nanoarchaeota archaeon]